MSESSSTNTSSGSTPANSEGDRSATLTAVASCRRRLRQLVAATDVVQGRSLGRGSARAVRGGDEVPRLQPHAVVTAGHPADRLLHQGSAEIVDTPPQRLGGGVEPHLHPARLEVANGATEGEPEGRGVLEVLGLGDLLDPVGSAEQGVEGNEGQRNELGEASGALLELRSEERRVGKE